MDSNDEIRTIAAGLNHMAGRIKVLMEEKAQIEIKKKEAEIMMLQRQIRPHFLYNTLDGIRMKALLNQDHEAAEMIEKLSLLLRRTTDMKTEYVKVREELEYVTCYIEPVSYTHLDVYKRQGFLLPQRLPGSMLMFFS